MTDQTKAPERIWLLPFDGEQRCWCDQPDPSGLGHEDEADKYIRADIAAEQAREAYERGIAAVANYVINALKSDDTNEASASPLTEPSPGRAVSSVAPAAWQPIETAPRDETAILVIHSDSCDDPRCPLSKNHNEVEAYPRFGLCVYHAHGEGLSYGYPGFQMAVWGGSWEDSWEDGGGSMPDWWFQLGSEFEVVLNPTHWMPLPPAPQETTNDK